MKVQATVTLTVNAESLGEAGRLLDEVVGMVRGRDRVRVDHVELRAPAEQVSVTLPPPVVQPARPSPAPAPPTPGRPQPSFSAR